MARNRMRIRARKGKEAAGTREARGYGTPVGVRVSGRHGGAMAMAEGSQATRGQGRGGIMEKKQITTLEVQQALKNFREKGGLVLRLPAEKVPRHAMVGNKHGMFENPVEIAQNWGMQNSFF